MKLALQLATPLHEHVVEGARRLRGVTLASEGEAHDALVTDDPDAAQAAADEGRHVLLDALDPSGIRSVDEACRRSGTTFMPSHPWRFRASVQAILRSHQAGNLGAPGLVRIHRWSAVPASRLEPDTILPEVDLILWVFGAAHEAAHVVATGTDFLQIHLGFAGGGMALVDYAWGVAGDYDSLSLIGGDGAAYADDHHNMHLLFAPGPVQAIKTGPGAGHHIYGLVKEFAEAIDEGRAPAVAASDTLLALETAQTLVNAAQASGGAR